MTSLYETIAALAFDHFDPQYEDGSGFARSLLKAIREPPPEVLASGLDARSWRFAIDAALKEADRADAAARATEIEEFQQRWPSDLAGAIAAGAVVKSLVPNGDVLQVWCDGRDLYHPFPWTIVLSSASVTDASGDPVFNFFEDGRTLADVVAAAIGERAAKRRESKRRKILRERYRWDRAQWAYLPIDGVGPPVKPNEDPPGLD